MPGNRTQLTNKSMTAVLKTVESTSYSIIPNNSLSIYFFISNTKSLCSL